MIITATATIGVKATSNSNITIHSFYGSKYDYNTIYFNAIGNYELNITNLDTVVLILHEEPGSFFFSFNTVYYSTGSKQYHQQQQQSDDRPGHIHHHKYGYPSFGYIEFIRSYKEINSMRSFNSHINNINDDDGSDGSDSRLVIWNRVHQMVDINHHHHFYHDCSVIDINDNIDKHHYDKSCRNNISNISSGSSSSSRSSSSSSSIGNKEVKLNICIFSANKIDGQRVIWLSQSKYMDKMKFRYGYNDN
jgi:hypothetical protein